MIAPSKVAKKKKPAEVPPEDPRSRAPANKLDCSLLPPSELAIAKLQRHPLNRHPSAAAVDKMVASIQSEGLLEPPVVRPLAGGNYQIISGETRVLAWRKLKRPIIVAKVLSQCTDARALELLAVFNAERTDLTPIEKAEMIQRLCAPPAEGGASMSREQAAKIYGLESGAAASNLVGLLKLPKFFQNLVAAGELPQTFARLLVPYAGASRIMEALEKQYKEDHGPKGEPDDWESRSALESALERWVDDLVRPVEKGHKMNFDGDVFKSRCPKGTSGWRYSGSYACLFELTPELEKQLDIVELEVRGEWKAGKRSKERRRVATNLPVYDKLQIPLAIKQHDEREKKQASRSAGKESKSSEKKKLTPAQQRAADAEKQKQLEARLANWRHTWLQRLVASEIASELSDPPIWITMKFLLWFCACKPGRVAASELLADLIKSEDSWDCDVKFAEVLVLYSEDQITSLAYSYAQALLAAEDINPKFQRYPIQLLENLARDLKIDLAHEWLELAPEALEVFLELHQGPQLEPLAKEWELFFPTAISGRSARIKFILDSNKKKPLPSTVPAIAAGKRGGM